MDLLIHHISVEEDITTNIAYQVEFIRLVNGLPLANGDGVRVILDNSGVKSYTNGLRLIQGVSKPQKVISVDRAFSELESKLHLAFNMPEKVEITDIKLVYYVSNMGKAQSVVHPAWAFKLSENNYAYVDAFTGTILLDY